MRLFPDIRYGTERYPEKVARRLRALNISAWVGSALTCGFAVVQFLDATGELWMVATANAVTSLALAAIPLLHRFGPMVVPIVFTMTVYAATFAICSMLGTGTGMQSYYFVSAALVVFYVGTERIILASVLVAFAMALAIALEVLVPYNAGLQSDAILFVNFVVTTVASCGILFMVALYAVREISRAEAVAELQFQRSETLLNNILPAAIADRLKRRTGQIIADKFDEASILFADMAGFTARTSDTTPEDLVQFLNRVFSDFDRLVQKHGLEKIKTTGDAYMVVSGVPAPRADHAQALARLALDMRDIAMNLRDPHGRSVPIRIGIAGGPVVAGVVGTRKFFYDVWGDAVNVASRMESTGEPGKIQVSQDIHERLKQEFVLEKRGLIDVKGKGQMPTWFLVGGNALPAGE